MKFLLCGHRTAASEEATRLGEMLAHLAAAEAVRLRVAANPRDAATDPGRVRLGDPVEQILAEAVEGNFDLIVIGSSGGRGLAKWLMGSTASRLAKRSPVPLLIVKGKRDAMQQLLICTGGEPPGELVARWGGQMAAWTGASLTVLHVMSQLPLAKNSKLEDLRDSAEEAMAHGTREGKHLQKVVALVRNAGAGAEVKPKLRHGLVLDEILDEVESGDYDLVIIGAHHAPPGQAWRGLLLDDVAEQIIAQCPRSVLVVKAK